LYCFIQDLHGLLDYFHDFPKENHEIQFASGEENMYYFFSAESRLSFNTFFWKVMKRKTILNILLILSNKKKIKWNLFIFYNYYRGLDSILLTA